MEQILVFGLQMILQTPGLGTRSLPLGRLLEAALVHRDGARTTRLIRQASGGRTGR